MNTSPQIGREIALRQRMIRKKLARAWRGVRSGFPKRSYANNKLKRDVAL
jgi:hypothetical protein